MSSGRRPTFTPEPLPEPPPRDEEVTCCLLLSSCCPTLLLTTSWTAWTSVFISSLVAWSWFSSFLSRGSQRQPLRGACDADGPPGGRCQQPLLLPRHQLAGGSRTCYLHDSAVPAAIQSEKLIGLQAVRRDGGRTGARSQSGLPRLHLFAAQGLGERGLQQQQVSRRSLRRSNACVQNPR